MMSITLVSPVYSFLEEVKSIFTKNCNAGDPTIHSRQGCFVVKWGGNNQCRRICEYLYSDDGPNLQRKVDFVKNHLENTKNIIYRKSNNFKTKSKIENPKIPSELDRILGFI